MHFIAALTALGLLAFGPRPGAAQAPADREAIRLAVLDYVEGFYEGDTTRLVKSVWPEVRKYGYWRSKPDAPFGGEAMPFPEFMAYANRVKSGKSRTPAGAAKEIVVFDVQALESARHNDAFPDRHAGPYVFPTWSVKAVVGAMHGRRYGYRIVTAKHLSQALETARDTVVDPDDGPVWRWGRSRSARTITRIC